MISDKPGIPKTAQFIDTYYPTIDGVIRTVHSYASYLEPLVGCTVVCPRVRGYRDEQPYPVLRTPGFRVPFMGYSCPTPALSPGLRRSLAAGQYQLFHAHSPFTLGHYAISAGRALGVPVVATFHTKFYDDVKRLTGSETLARAVVAYIVRFFERVDAVWSVNAATASTLRDYGYKGDIFLINNGSDFTRPADPAAAADRAAARFSIARGPGAPKILLFTGHLIWQKNLRLILDTVKLLAGQKTANLIMLFVGTGYNEEAIRAYADSLDLGGTVRFLGQISDRDLLSGVYAMADLFFFPSLYDNAPLVVREAASLGTPPLLTAGSNSADGVTDGDNGYTAPDNPEAMAAKITDIFSDPARHAAVAARAAETIPVSWDEILPRAVAEYNEVIARYRADGPATPTEE